MFRFFEEFIPDVVYRMGLQKSRGKFKFPGKTLRGFFVFAGAFFLQIRKTSRQAALVLRIF
jgi:hypothetical protein